MQAGPDGRAGSPANAGTGASPDVADPFHWPCRRGTLLGARVVQHESFRVPWLTKKAVEVFAWQPPGRPIRAGRKEPRLIDVADPAIRFGSHSGEHLRIHAMFVGAGTCQPPSRTTGDGPSIGWWSSAVIGVTSWAVFFRGGEGNGFSFCGQWAVQRWGRRWVGGAVCQ